MPLKDLAAKAMTYFIGGMTALVIAYETYLEYFTVPQEWKDQVLNECGHLSSNAFGEESIFTGA